MTGPRPIELVRVGAAEISDDVLHGLAVRLRDALACRVVIGEPLPLADLATTDAPSAGDDSAEIRLCSNRVIDTLVERSDSRADDRWTLGITAHDLFAPDRPFVFGEATLGGCWALISAARFGLPKSGSPRLLDRLFKEALHEIGHLAALDHCDRPACPMAISRRVADVDAKNLRFCEDCERRIFPGKGLDPRTGGG